MLEALSPHGWSALQVERNLLSNSAAWLTRLMPKGTASLPKLSLERCRFSYDRRSLSPPSRIYLLRHAEAGWAEPGQQRFRSPSRTSRATCTPRSLPTRLLIATTGPISWSEFHRHCGAARHGRCHPPRDQRSTDRACRFVDANSITARPAPTSPFIAAQRDGKFRDARRP
jgi:hypothetical protein